MKLQRLLGLALVVPMVIAGCGQDSTVGPQGATGPVAGETDLAPMATQPFVTFATNHDPTSGAFTELEMIDPVTGVGTIVASLGVPIWDDEKGLSCPLGLEFDEDGQVYTIVNWLFGPTPLAQLARVDLDTGATTFIGEPYGQHFSSPVMDRHGDLYAVGFNRGPAGQEEPVVFIGDGCLYLIDKHTGEAVNIGFTGLYDIMDMAFDRRDRLYATTANNLYLVDTGSGAATLVAPLSGVPMNECGTVQLEVMSIGFDHRGVLFATAIQGFAFECYETTPFMTIDPTTGVADVIGWTGQWYNHGGDVAPVNP